MVGMAVMSMYTGAKTVLLEKFMVIVAVLR